MTSVGAEVLVIGDALLDVSARSVLPVRSGADVPADIRLAPGGQGANVAVRLARRGVRVGLVCGLGADTAAALVTGALQLEGIELIAVPVPSTGTVVIVLGEDGERTMLSQRSPFSASVLAAGALPPGPEWIVVSGYLLLEPDARDFTRAVAARSARRVLLGCTMPDATAAADWVTAAKAMRPDLLVLNAAEAEEVEGGATISAGVVTTSERVVRATIGGVSAAARTPDGEPAIDTTGAGDAFAAALVAALTRADWPPTMPALEAALGAATTLASAVARTPGAQGRVAGEPAATLRR